MKLLGGDIALLGRLGSGGFSTTFLGRQLSTGTECAVKTLPPSDGVRSELLLRESRILARVPSDHVPRVLRIGDTEVDGGQWFAMELIRGEALDIIADDRGLDTIAAIDVILDICNALDAAHRRGIVHCDVKPSNIIVVPTSERAYSAYLIDFGCAKWVAEAEDLLQGIDGTPPFMAPEQLQSRDLITPATDVWAIGLLGFYLFTGQYYWPATKPSSGAKLGETEGLFDEFGDTLDDVGPVLCPAPNRSGSIIDIIRDVLDAPLVRASQRARQIGCAAELPVWFDDWFASCVCRDAKQRFATAGKAALALREYREGLGSQVHMPQRGAVDAFISYSPKDMPFCDELLIHLSMMRRQGLINEWHDRLIAPGSVADEETTEWLSRCELIMTLLSADYIASDKCFGWELQAAMKKHQAQTGHVVPILVRACDWAHPPFSHLPTLPQSGIPISSWSNRDEGWAEVVRDIRPIVQSLHNRRALCAIEAP